MGQGRALLPNYLPKGKGIAHPSLPWEHTALGAGTEELPAGGKKGKARVGLVGNGDCERRLQGLSPGRAVPADGAPIPQKLSQPCSMLLRKPGC